MGCQEGFDLQVIFLGFQAACAVDQASAWFDARGSGVQDGFLESSQLLQLGVGEGLAHIWSSSDHAGVGAGHVKEGGVHGSGGQHGAGGVGFSYGDIAEGGQVAAQAVELG
ncbi:MAG TPA: hypothetical protein PLT23_12485, partial [Lentisphaeria bacterium]|nr:hypothetical protein [Lentisphaeria bacterium]